MTWLRQSVEFKRKITIFSNFGAWQIISMRRIHCQQDSGNFKAETKSMEEEQIIKD